MVFDSQIEGFSPVAVVSVKEIQELQHRNRELMEANTRAVEERRHLQRQVNSLYSHLQNLRLLLVGHKHYQPDKFAPLLTVELDSAFEKHETIKSEGR